MNPRLHTWNSCRRFIQQARKEGQRVVFTNGCFDLLHVGHVGYLAQARALGDLLIVGINSDDSVRRLKGPNRPIVPQRDRAVLLAALACVDAVVPFEEDTPIPLILHLLPDLLVKGGDRAENEVVGREVVENYGGEVTTLLHVEGSSTTNLIRKVRRNFA